MGDAAAIVVCLLMCCGAAVGNPVGMFLDRGDVFAPTVEAGRGACRDHSLLYVEELRKFKLWAVEMSDASSKFSSGVLYGSTYDLGTFDQCLAIKVPRKAGGFSGKYCLAKFVIHPPKNPMKTIDFDVEDYTKYYNVSAWDKIRAFKDKDNRNTRNELYHSFCIPSSCSSEDLQNSLIKVLHQNGTFKVEVEVDDKLCQVQGENSSFSNGDIGFLVFLALVFLVVVVASCYDLVTTKMDDFDDYKLPGRLHELLICFSMPENLKKLASHSKNEDGLDSLAGIKVLSMFLIIMGHRCMFVFGSPLENPPFIEAMYRRIDAALILNGPIIVDTFLLISGFLAAYMILLRIDRQKKLGNIGILYLHRLLRLVPAYAVVIAFYSTVFIKIGSGPFWKQRVGVEKERCSKNWWLNLLFINNYVNTDEICMFQSWYLDCDIHFYFIMPFIVFLIYRKPIAGLFTTLLLLFTSVLVGFVIVYVNKEDAILLLYTKLLKDPISNETFRKIYIPSHMRASPYLVGILAGYLKYKMKVNGTELSKYTVRFGWILGVTISLATMYSGFVFYVPHVRRDAIFSAFYGSMHHVTWSVCMAFVMLAVSTGNGPWLEPLFSWPPFILMGRITYTAFICHGAIQIFTAAYIRQPIYSGVFNVLYMSAADIFYSYLIGFFLSMFFEAPVMGIERLLFQNSTRLKKDDSDLTASSDFGVDNMAFENSRTQKERYKQCQEKS